MNIHFEELLEKMTNFMKEEANTKTVIGDSFQLGEFSCIPVIRVGMGFGTGGGEGDDAKKGHGEGGGAGGGMGIEPLGFLVSRGADISFVSTKQNRGLAAAFEKVPELMDKFLETRKKEMEPVEA